MGVQKLRNSAKLVKKINIFTTLVNEDYVNYEKQTINNSNLVLSGKTFVVKDNFCTSDAATTCGSK